jgi:hypothetical protein
MAIRARAHTALALATFSDVVQIRTSSICVTSPKVAKENKGSHDTEHNDILHNDIHLNDNKHNIKNATFSIITLNSFDTVMLSVIMLIVV